MAGVEVADNTKSEMVYLKWAKRTREPIERLMAWLGDLGSEPFIDPKGLSWTAALERRSVEIYAELEDVLDSNQAIPRFQDINGLKGKVDPNHDWQAFLFFGYGARDEANCRRCPITAQAVSEIPGMEMAFFSIMRPNRHMPAHRGVWRGVLRYHLGLRIPADFESCGIRVANETRHWQFGKSLVFEDAFEHEAWNHTDETRAVLIVDFKRRLPLLAALINHFMLGVFARSPYARAAKRRQAEWQRMHAGATL